MALETVEMDSAAADTAVIWLHGLGADGYDFQPIAAQLDLPATRFVFPHAPHCPITLNGGAVMRGWYDIHSLDADAPQDVTGIGESAVLVRHCIEAELARGIAAHRVVLAGFSQGSVLALHTALRFDRPLAGVLALSGYLALASELAVARHAANQSTPIFMAHGRYDEVILPQYAQASAQALTAHGYTVTWRDYPMAHTVCPEQINDVRDFLRHILGHA